MKKKKKFGQLQILNSTVSSVELAIYGDIVATGAEKESWEDLSPADAHEFLDYAAGREIDIYINSPGGDALAGVAIYNMLKNYPAAVRAHVESQVGSISTLVLFAADEVYMPTNASLMIHRAWSEYIGTTEDFKKVSEMLARIDDMIIEVYLENAKGDLTREKIIEMMDAETWIVGVEAVDMFEKFIKTEPVKARAKIKDPGMFKNIPQLIKDSLREEEKEKDGTALAKAKLELLLESMEG